MGFNDIDIKVSGGSDIISTLKTYTTRILKPNIVDGKNVLTQEMLSSKNTKYIIKYVYELLGDTLTMPQNVIFEFDGGSIKNGTLVGNDTLMLNTNETESVLDNVTLGGTWKESSYDLVEEVVADKAPGDGMGRIILRKDKTFKEQLTQENTIYVIRYDFELTKDVTIPANCVLQFEGGSISGNKTLTGNNTGIEAGLVRILGIEITIAGTWNVTEVFTDWFGEVTDISVAIAKGFTIYNKVTLNDEKEYELLTPITVINGQILRMGDEYRHPGTGYAQIAQNNTGCKINTHVYPALIVCGGGTTIGGHIRPATGYDPSHTDYYILYKEKPSPSSNIYESFAKIINIKVGENRVNNINNAKGIGLKYNDGESLYYLTLSGTFYYLDLIVDASTTNHKAGAKFDISGAGCRRVIDANTLYDIQGNLINQSTYTSRNDDIDLFTFNFNKCGGFVYARNWDAHGKNVPSSNKYYFNNELQVINSPELVFTENCRFGFLSRESYSNYYSEFNNSGPKLGQNNFKNNIDGYNILESLTPDSYTINKYKVNWNSGVTIDKLLGDGNMMGRYLYQFSGEDGYVEFEPTFKYQNPPYGEEAYDRIPCYGFGVTYNDGQTPHFPKLVLITAVFNNGFANVTKKFCIIANNLNQEDIITEYSNYIYGEQGDFLQNDVIFIRANTYGEYYVDRLDRVFNTSGLSAYRDYSLTSINFKLIGCVNGINMPMALSSIIVNVPKSYDKKKNIFTKSNIWFGEQNFAELVRSKGNQGTTRPTLTSEDIGTIWFDKALSPARPIWWNGTAWVDATGTVV